jgi:site-specific recombinase XerD
MDKKKFFKEMDIDALFASSPPEGLTEGARRRLKRRAPKNTDKTYKNQVKKFLDYGNTIPATEIEVINYINTLHEEGYSSNTIGTALSAIAKAHKLNGLEFHTKGYWLKKMIAEAATESENIIRRATPLPLDELKMIINDFRERFSDLSKQPTDRLANRRDAALFLVMFASASRISEMINLRVGDIKETPEGIIMNIRSSKTNKTREQIKAIPYSGGDHCPAIELLEYMRILGFDPKKEEQHNYHLFFSTGRNSRFYKKYYRTSRRNGRIKRTTVTDLLWIRRALKTTKPFRKPVNQETYYRRIYKTTKRTTGKKYSAHSFRAGFVTEAIHRGMSDHSIMAMTGHTNVNTMRVYLREANKFRHNASAGMFD